MGKKLSKFLDWVDGKKGRMKKVIVSILLTIFLLGVIAIGIVFILTFGYDKESGWNKDPAKVEVDINIKKKGD